MNTDIMQYDLLAPVLPAKAVHITQADGAELVDAGGKHYVDLNEMCQVLGQNNQPYIRAMSEAIHGITTSKVGFSSAKAELYEHLRRTTDGAFSGIH